MVCFFLGVSPFDLLAISLLLLAVLEDFLGPPMIESYCSLRYLVCFSLVDIFSGTSGRSLENSDGILEFLVRRASLYGFRICSDFLLSSSLLFRMLLESSMLNSVFDSFCGMSDSELSSMTMSGVILLSGSAELSFKTGSADLDFGSFLGSGVLFSSWVLGFLVDVKAVLSFPDLKVVFVLFLSSSSMVITYSSEMAWPEHNSSKLVI